MRKLRKTLALLLALCMTVSMLGTTAFADEGDGEPTAPATIVEQNKVKDDTTDDLTDDAMDDLTDGAMDDPTDDAMDNPTDDSADNATGGPADDPVDDPDPAVTAFLADMEALYGVDMDDEDAYIAVVKGVLAKYDALTDGQKAELGEDVAGTMEALRGQVAELTDAIVSGTMTGAALLGKAVDGVITLNGDVTLTSTMTVNKDITLELSGHTLCTQDVSGGNNASARVLLTSGAVTLTIQNGTVKGGTIYNSDANSPNSAVKVNGNATLIVDNATIKGADTVRTEEGTNKYQRSGASAIDTWQTNTVIIRNGSKVEGGNGTGYGTEYISGGKNQAGGGKAISMGAGTLTITDSTVTGGSSSHYNAEDAITVGGTTVTITNSTVTGGTAGRTLPGYGIGGDAISVTSNGADITVENSTIAVGAPGHSWAGICFELPGNPKGDVTISLENGTKLVAAQKGDPVVSYCAGTNAPNIKMNVSGTVTVSKGKLANKYDKPQEISFAAQDADTKIVTEEGATIPEEGTTGAIKLVPPEGAEVVKDDNGNITFKGAEVARVGDQTCATLTKAFAAVATASDKTITLLKDVDYTKENSDTRVAVNVSGVTIDLNGKTVTTGYTSSNEPLLILLGDFTLKNGKVQAKGSYGIFTGNVAGAVDPNKVAKIEDVEVLDGGVNAGSVVELTNVTATGNTYYAVWSESDGVVIKSGNYSSDGYAVLGISSQHGSMTVESGTFTANGTASMVLGSGGKPLIKGGTFNKDMGAENATLDESLQWAKDSDGNWTVEEKPENKFLVYISTGFEIKGRYETIQAAIDAYTEEDSTSYNFITLGADRNEDVTVAAGKNIQVETDGHTWTGTITNNGSILFYPKNNPTKIDVTINCGEGATVEFSDETYSHGKIEGEFVRGWTKWMYTDEEGWFVASSSCYAKIGDKEFRTVQHAINAAQNGETVTLNKTTNENLVVPAGKNITLDLNKQKLQNPSSDAGKSQPVITNNGTLTIKDGKNGSSGLSQRSGATAPLMENTGTLTVESGKLTPASDCKTFKNTGTVTVKGGTFAEDISLIATPGEGLEFAEDGKGVVKAKVAQITTNGVTTKYETLQAAIDAAQSGDTVTLLADIQAQLPNNFGYAYEAAMSIEKDLVLDGGNHKITIDTSNWQKFENKPTGYVFNVGVQDGHKVEGSENSVTVTIKDLTIEGNAEYVRAGINAYAMRTPTEDTGVTNLTLENVDITGFGTYSLGVNNSTVSVKDCNLANGEWQQAISVDKGTTNLTVESGIIDNIFFGGNGTKNNASITGGTIAGVFVEEGSDSKQAIAISGGTFSTEILAAWCADGFQPVNNNGTWSVAEIPTPSSGGSGTTSYRLTINYVYEDGSEAAPAYTRRMTSGRSYEVESPAIEGFTPDQDVVEGRLSRNTTVTVTYAEDEEIDEPDVPLTDLPLPFVDVDDGAWYREAVAYVYSNDLIKGVEETVFAPGVNTTRGMIATMLHRLEKEPQAAAGADFSDVLADTWYKAAIDWAVEAGVISGYGDGLCGPEDDVTREQLVTILYRYAQLKGRDVSARADLTRFTDADEVSGYAAEAMSWAVAAGLVEGTSPTTLAPTETATRAQVSLIMMRLCENVLAETSIV